MPRDTGAKAKISSLASPTEEEISAFESLSEEEKRQLIEAEIEKGLTGQARKVAAAEIIAAVNARRRRG